jgi:hypothetical protein
MTTVPEEKITIELDGEGLLDRVASEAIFKLVDLYRDNPSCKTLLALSEHLGIHRQRCSRLVRAIDRIRERTKKSL